MRVVSFDPSLVNLGYCYGVIIGTTLVVEASGTFRPDKFLKDTGMFDTGDLTTDRQLAVEYFIRLALNSYKPLAIGGETSFYNGCNPSTIIQQSKGLGLIEKVCREYLVKSRSPFELCLYQPNVIKRALGLSKEEFKDKTKIDEYINLRCKEGRIKYLDNTHRPENQLDHANDAVAMTFTLTEAILAQNLTTEKPKIMRSPRTPHLYASR